MTQPSLFPEPVPWAKVPDLLLGLGRKHGLRSYMTTLQTLHRDHGQGQTLRLKHADIAAEHGCCRKHAMRLAKQAEDAGLIVREHPDPDVVVIRFTFALKGARPPADAPQGDRASAGRAPRAQAGSAPRAQVGSKGAPTLGSKGAPTLPLSLRETSGETEEEKFKARERDGTPDAPPADAGETGAQRTARALVMLRGLDQAERDRLRAAAVASEPLAARRGQGMLLEALMADMLMRARPEDFPGEARPDPDPAGAARESTPAPPQDPLEYIRLATGFKPGGRRDLAVCMARKLRKFSSAARYRQALAWAEGHPDREEDVAQAFKEALNQTTQKPGLYFDFALVGLIPKAQKPPCPVTFHGARAGRLESQPH